MGYKKRRVEVGVIEDLGAEAALAMLSDSTSGTSGFIRQIRDVVLRKSTQDKKYYLIDVKNPDGTAIDKKMVNAITTQVNASFKKKGTPTRIRWIESDPKTGNKINKFLAVPADKYKDFIGGK